MKRSVLVSLGLCAALIVAVGCDDDGNGIGGSGNTGGDAGTGGSGGSTLPGGSGGTAGEGTGAAGGGGSGGDTGGSGGTGGEPVVETRAATFNVALTPFYEQLVDERRGPIMDYLAVAANDLDVLCVQEFWLESDWELLVTRLAEKLPNAYRPKPERNTGTCDKPELDNVAFCLLNECASLSGEDLANCAFSACGDAVAPLHPSCLNCLMGTLDLPFTQVYFSCLGASSPGGALFGGTFDMGLLTRKPLVDAENYRFADDDSYAVRSAIVYGALEEADGELTHVFCTHLSSGLRGIDYQGPYADWDAQHARQVERMREFITAKAPTGRVIVLGDLNMGPACGDNIAVLPNDFEALVRGNDLLAPFVDAADPVCTICRGNTLQGKDVSPKLIDHVLIRGLRPREIERFMTEEFPVDMNEPPTMSSFSDHYGLRAWLEPPRSRFP